MFHRTTEHVFEDLDSCSLSELHRSLLRALGLIQTEISKSLLLKDDFIFFPKSCQLYFFIVMNVIN